MEKQTTTDQTLLDTAAEQVATLWLEQMQRPFNKNNGDDNPLLFLLSAQLTQNAQISLTPQKIDLFKKSIIRQIQEHYKAGKMDRFYIHTDYDADETLSIACRDADMSPDCLPWKSFTSLYLAQKQIDYKFGYAASVQTLQIL